MIAVFDDWQSVPAEWTGGVVALGNFDGVHRGHQALLAAAAQQARTLGVPLLALTFEPHPRRFFVPDTGPFRLTLPPAKLRLLAGCGVGAVLAQRFDASAVRRSISVSARTATEPRINPARSPRRSVSRAASSKTAAIPSPCIARSHTASA